MAEFFSDKILATTFDVSDTFTCLTLILYLLLTSSKKEAAKVFVNFLISPYAQIRKQDNNFWGDPSVLSMDKLDIEWKNRFNEISRGVATLSNDDLKMKLQEPHPSWVKALEEGWIKRYGS